MPSSRCPIGKSEKNSTVEKCKDEACWPLWSLTTEYKKHTVNSTRRSIGPAAFHCAGGPRSVGGPKRRKCRGHCRLPVTPQFGLLVRAFKFGTGDILDLISRSTLSDVNILPERFVAVGDATSTGEILPAYACLQREFGVPVSADSGCA
jgi:hypothetical protein